MDYEVYREVYQVTDWRDGAIRSTESQGARWVSQTDVDANRPADTGLVYASPPSSYRGATIRAARRD